MILHLFAVTFSTLERVPSVGCMNIKIILEDVKVKMKLKVK
jgi:hypothetical protein